MIFSVGENVDALFTRVAAVVFERIMEAESREQEQKQATIGPSNTLISESWHESNNALIFPCTAKDKLPYKLRHVIVYYHTSMYFNNDNNCTIANTYQPHYP